MSFIEIVDIPAQAGCGSNTPGLKTVHVINMSQLVTPLPTPDPGTRTITTNVALVGTQGFGSWTFLQKDAQHTETANDTGNYDTSVKLNFSKDDDLKRYMFNEMNNPCDKWGIIYTDNNNVTKLITDLNFKDNYDTGQGESDQINGFNVEFYKTGPKCYIYEGTIPVPV